MVSILPHSVCWSCLILFRTFFQTEWRYDIVEFYVGGFYGCPGSVKMNDSFSGELGDQKGMIHYSIFCNDDITEIFLRDALHYHYITKIADVMTLHYILLLLVIFSLHI